MLQEVTLLTNPFSLLSSMFCLTQQGLSQNPWHLTDCTCSVCLLISETLSRVLFIFYIGKQKNNKTSCSSHESDTAVAGSEFRSPKSNPSWWTPLWSTSLGQHNPSSAVWQSCVHCLPKTTKPSHSQWLGAQFLSTEQKWTGLDVVKVHEFELGWLGSVRFGPPPSDVATVYNRWHVIWKEFGGSSACGCSPLRGTVEPERMLGLLEARVRLRNICHRERSTPQYSAAGRVEVAKLCQISWKTQTCIQGFQPLPAVCVRFAYRRAWHLWNLPGHRQGPPG